MLGKIREWHEGVNTKNITSYFKRQFHNFYPNLLLRLSTVWQDTLGVRVKQITPYRPRKKYKRTYSEFGHIALSIYYVTLYIKLHHAASRLHKHRCEYTLQTCGGKSSLEEVLKFPSLEAVSPRVWTSVLLHNLLIWDFWGEFIQSTSGMI